jgi:hypothetical protein
MDTKHACRWAAPLLPLVAACYAQGPLITPVPAPGTHIVALVTDSGVVAMSNALGPGSTEVEGVVAAADASAWDLRMVRVDYRGGTSIAWNHELVTFPRPTLTRATEKRLDRGKSWIVAGAITATALLAARLFGAIGGGETPNTIPPPPN